MFNIDKSDNGLIYSHHIIVDSMVNMQNNTVTLKIRSWKNELDATNNANNYTTFTAKIIYQSWNESNLDDLENKVKLVNWIGQDEQQEAQVETLPQAKERKYKEINTARDLLEKGGFSYMGKIFQSDIISVTRLSIAAQSALAAIQVNAPFSINWTTKDNSAITLDAQQMLGAPVALAQYSKVLHEQALIKKSLVFNATTIEEVNAVTW